MKNAKLRLALHGTTALASMLLFAAPAMAQNLPDTGNVTQVNAGLGGAVPTTPVFTPTPTPTGTELRVDLRNNRTLLNWGGTGFDIAAGNSVNFKDARAASGVTNRTDNIAVLNRDLSGSASNIYGLLKSDPNVGVYLINTRGIILGVGGSVDVGSFFASTRDVGDADFLDGDTSLTFGPSGDNSSPNEIELGGPVNTAANGSSSGGRMGDIVIVGQRIWSNGSSLTARNGDIGIIGAEQVTVQNAPGSPLSFTIARGTTNLGIYGTYNATAKNITLAMANAGTPSSGPSPTIYAGLQATGADVTDRGVVLTSGMPAPGVTFASTPSTVAGSNITTGGSLALYAYITSASGISISAFDSIRTYNAITAAGLIDINAENAFGASRIDGKIKGGSVTIRGGGAFDVHNEIETTVGDFRSEIASFDTDSAIKVAGNLVSTSSKRFVSLLSSIAVAGTSSITGGLIVLKDLQGVGSISVTGTAASGDVALRKVTSTAGDITVRSAGRVDVETGYAAGMLDLQSDHSVYLKDGTGVAGVKLTSSLTPSAGGSTVHVGTARATGASADLIISALFVGGYSGADNEIITLSAGRDARIETGTEYIARFTTLDAGRNITTTGGGVVATRITAAAGFASLTGPIIRLGTLNAGTDASVTGDQIELTTVTAGTGDININAAPGLLSNGSLTLGSGNAGRDFIAKTTGGVMSVGSAIAGRDLKMTAINNSLTLQSGSAGRNFEASATRLATLVGNITATGNLSVTGAGVTLGSTASASLQRAGGTVLIDGGSGTITGLQNLTLQSDSDGTGGEALTLTTNGVVNFAASSSLLGGSARQSNVQIRSASGQALTLGAISGRGLLGATGTDAFTRGLTRLAPITIMGTASFVDSLALSGTAVTLGRTTVTGGDISINASEYFQTAGIITASQDVRIVTGTSGLGIGQGGQINGANVVLSTTGNFNNQSGASAVTASVHWVIYAANPGNSIFGNLDSNNVAYWGSTLATRAPDTLAGNHYVFAVTPTLTFRPANLTKIYGEDYTGQFGTYNQRFLYTVTGYQPGVAGAFKGDTAETSYQNLPTFISNGLGMYAKVLGGPYALTLAANPSLVSSNGYAIVIDNSGNAKITVAPKPLTITYVANNKAYDGTTTGTGTVNIDGLIGQDYAYSPGTTWTFDNKNVGTGRTVTVAGTVIQPSGVGTDLSNYTWTLPGNTVTADIFKRQLRIDIESGAAKTYDGTTAAPNAFTRFVGVVAGEDVHYTGGTLEYLSKNASRSAVITLVGTVSLTGADIANYEYTGFTIGHGEILQKNLTGSIIVNNKIYDGTRTGSGAVTLSGVIAGDVVNAGGATFTFDTKNVGTGKTVTMGGLTLTGADMYNYSLVIFPTTATADITAKALTTSILVNNRTYDGTAGATGLVTLNGVVSGDTVGTTGTLFAFADKNAGTGKTVNISGTTLTGADAANYTFTIAGTALADIFKKALTGTYTANGKTYDGTTGATGTLTIAGVLAGETVGTTGSVFAFADKNAGTGKAVSISGTTLTGADAGNYTLAISGGAVADILKKALTGTITANNKTYDGTTAGSGSVALNGVVSGDAVGTTGTVFTFADKNAGAGKAVTVSGTSLSGADAGNYTLSLSATAVADILKKALTGTYTANGKTYDGTTGATGTVMLSGVIGGDTVGTTGSVFAFADKNAGTGKTVNVSGTTLNGADAGNYTLAISGGAVADILKKALTGSVTANNKTYDGNANGTGTVTLNGVVSGDTVGTTGTVFTFADKNAGTGKTVTVSGTSLSGADAGNYTLTLSGSVFADILKKALTGTITANTKTYDGTTGATGSVTLNGVISGDDVVTSGTVFAFADKNAGNGKTVNVSGTALGGADAGNYALTLSATTVADILKKALTGTITANGKTYDGTTAGSGTVTLNGVIGGDIVGTTGSVWTFSDKNAGAGKTVTLTGTTLNGADGGNYALTLPGTALADIAKKALTGTVTANSKTYDGTTNGSGTVTLSGVVQGDTVGTTGSVWTFSDKNAGAGKTVTLSGTSLSGTDAGNYTLSGVPGSALADILKKALTGTVTINGRTYDGTTNATGMVTLSGVVQGETVGTTGSTFAFADKNAGTGKTVIVNGTTLTGADAANYTLSVSAAVGDIFKKAITATATANNKTYDGTTAGSGTVTIEGVLAGDTVGTTGTTWTFANKNAGTGKTVTISGTTLTGADGGNYTLTMPASTLADILKKSITGTVTITARQYDGTTAAAGAIGLNGVVAGDTVGTSGTVLTYADKNAGTGKTVTVGGTTVLTGADAGNYTLTTMPASALGDILKRTVSVAADNKSKNRNDDDPLLTFTITSGSLVSGDSFTGALVRAAGEAPGNYAITIGSLALNSNYTLTFSPGLLTIVLDPAESQPQILKTIPLPSQMFVPPAPSTNVEIDKEALCGEDAKCVAQ